MTKEDIQEFFSADAFTDGEIVDMLAVANADCEEGAEWLPYYKLSCQQLTAALGELVPILITSTPEAKTRVFNAAKMLYRSLLLGGIGPRREREVIVRCEEQASQAMSAMITEAGL